MSISLQSFYELELANANQHSEVMAVSAEKETFFQSFKDGIVRK
eukprot:CAMPEP_0202972674 /NCGR_PEP_ID=MMETSP1396-20130829/39037_1 /ASSEMBLY_ACC=CAM_ASM_000872 /TAXON_ID= /ORGANISM="Pseudokeronopsis sp., Strain Brazil" /LENGTH=43 /DNA_ID= /DNA_START= /DNA_END= /DNA_ORIENTATION=